MSLNPKASIIDFTNYITERTISFTGREWVFQAINDWLADPSGSRFFLLTGEPGCGKTAIAARLSQFSKGLPRPESMSYLTPNFLSAVHFCYASDNLWVDPFTFAGSIATQLANRYPPYLTTLQEAQQDRFIQINVIQNIQTVVNGPVVGVNININAQTPESAFNRVVREPLEMLFYEGFEQHVVILVDALDEALSYSENVNIVSLLAHSSKLPPSVRFILTSRKDMRVEKAFQDIEELILSATDYDQRNQEDISRYVQVRFSDDLELTKSAAQAETASIADLVEIVPSKAEGNFLYVRFLLDAMVKDPRPLMELEGLPDGLDALYHGSLDRMVKFGKRDWLNEYAPLMGVLSVAQESLTCAQLQAFTAKSESSVRQYLIDLRQFIEEIKPQQGQSEKETRYRLYHQSVIEFLQRQSLVAKKKQLPNTFYLPMKEWHAQIVEHYRAGKKTWGNVDWHKVDTYGLLYLTTHLLKAEIFQGALGLLEEPFPFLKSKIQHFQSYNEISVDLRNAMQAAMMLQDRVKLLGLALAYSGLHAKVMLLATSKVIPLYARFGEPERALKLAELISDETERAKTLVAVAQELIPTVRDGVYLSRWGIDRPPRWL